jgi:hypothetical protein
MFSVSLADAKSPRCVQYLTQSGHGAETFIIMCVETGVGIACGCLPGCKPLFNRCFPRYFGTTNNSSGSYPRRWQHNHAKQIDDEESIQPTASMASESIKYTSPRATDIIVTPKPAAPQQRTPSQSQNSITPDLSRTTSLTTTRTVNTNSMRTPNVHRSPSQNIYRSPSQTIHRSHSQNTRSTFTTTITAQSQPLRSTSRHVPKFGSSDLNKPLPIRPAPPALVARRPSASGFRRSRQASRELSTISNDSMEMFILQGRDGRFGRQSPERKDEVWAG